MESNDLDSQDYEGFQNPEDRAFMLSKIKSVFGNSRPVLQKKYSDKIPYDILQRPVSDLLQDEHIAQKFRDTGVTIKEALDVNPKNIPALRKLGAFAIFEINRRLKLFKMLEEKFFDDKALDTELIKELENHYGLKRIWLSDLIGESEISISMSIRKNINRGRWRGKNLNEKDKTVFSNMNDKNFSSYNSCDKKYLILKGENPENKALLVISNNKISCWLNADLPEDFRESINKTPSEIPDADEIATAHATGNIISIMKEKFFCPDDYQSFSDLALKRKMSTEEYSEFIFGFRLKKWNPNLITDDKIIKFFEKNKTKDGKIPTILKKENWISQFAKRNGFKLFEGILLSSPFIIYELFKYVSPALYENEKKYSFRVIMAAYSLFIIGLVVSYFLLFPISCRFLASYSVSEHVKTMVTLDSYISTFVSLTLLMGLVFQLPVISFFLAKMGIIEPSVMVEYRKHAFVLILIMAAIITPPDVMTLILVSLPLYILYELSIIVVKFSHK